MAETPQRPATGYMCEKDENGLIRDLEVWIMSADARTAGRLSIKATSWAAVDYLIKGAVAAALAERGIIQRI